MQNQAGSWIRAAEQSTKMNILCSPTHERQESYICKTGHNFFGLKHPKLKDWVTTYAPIPDNYYIYDIENGPWYQEFDICLIQSKFGQEQFLIPLAKNMGIPIIILEQTNSEHLHPKYVYQASQIRGDVNIFICKDQVKKWGMEDSNYKIIHHCVDSYFSPSHKIIKNKHILSVVNDFIGRGKILGFDLWKNLVNQLPYRIRGDSSGLSTSCKDISELREEYRNARVFLNTSYSSPIPSVMLEAAACGCAIVSTNTCGISEYFTHGYDALLSNNPKELREYIEIVLKDDKLATKLSENAIQTMKKKCSEERFIQEWNDTFEEIRLK